MTEQPEPLWQAALTFVGVVLFAAAVLVLACRYSVAVG